MYVTAQHHLVSLCVLFQDHPSTPSHRSQVSGYHGRPVHIDQQSAPYGKIHFFLLGGKQTQNSMTVLLLTKQNAFGMQDVDASTLS